ncbi:cyclopropane-fatty-acyl-phospholipid synthase [Edaphobacter paludis]|uniref:Cyclopropane-fatty-acyl-phospholipid synthase n=1 Tax=Edaphobacter paludis TaxID=3035702 RepID=A0AAU7CZF3_9BACT
MPTATKADALSHKLYAGLTHELEAYHGPSFELRLWDDTCATYGSALPEFTIIVKSLNVLKALLWNPTELTLGDAFVKGDLEVEGDIFAMFEFADFVFSGKHSIESPLSARRIAILATKALKRLQYAFNDLFVHTLRRDRQAISFHYDKPPEFFAPWLGPTMVYSCAYFCRNSESLEEAQRNKLDLICKKLRLHPGDQMLDIGCGWGSLILHAAKYYGVHATGITLSEQQFAFARRRIADEGLDSECEVRLCDYRELDHGVPTFDKIASVGMFEHVGWQNLGTYFETVKKLLKPGGAFLNHGIVSSLDEYKKHGPSFIRKYVFPDTELATLPIVTTEAEQAGFELRDVECLREHYERTLHGWVDRLEQCKRDLLNYADPETYRIWQLYMAGSAEAFRKAKISIYQMLFSKPGSEEYCEPSTRADWLIEPQGRFADAN